MRNKKILKIKVNVLEAKQGMVAQAPNPSYLETRKIKVEPCPV
jgi:hypothetical protein